MAGVADLPEMKGYSIDYTGSGSETVEYWRCVMGSVFRDKEAGKQIEYVVLEGEDHWLSKNKTRKQLLAEGACFINQHIGN